MTNTSTSPINRSRPVSNGAYYAASVLYNAGFRGWPLTIMTAIAGRESNWDPTALNNDPSTGDYSVGLTQVNYYGPLLSSRTASYGSPQFLQANPSAQANATYQLAGGNALSGLSNWNLSSSPANGIVPTPLSKPSKYSITPWLPQAAAAVGQVGTFGPAPAATTAQASNWPANGGPSVTASSGGYVQSATLTAATSNASGCSSKGNVFGEGGFLGIGSFSFTYCNLKALTGGLVIMAGGAIGIFGIAMIVVAGLGGKGPAAPAQSVLRTGRALAK